VATACGERSAWSNCPWSGGGVSRTGSGTAATLGAGDGETVGGVRLAVSNPSTIAPGGRGEAERCARDTGLFERDAGGTRAVSCRLVGGLVAAQLKCSGLNFWDAPPVQLFFGRHVARARLAFPSDNPGGAPATLEGPWRLWVRSVISLNGHWAELDRQRHQCPSYINIAHPRPVQSSQLTIMIQPPTLPHRVQIRVQLTRSFHDQPQNLPPRNPRTNLAPPTPNQPPVTSPY